MIADCLASTWSVGPFDALETDCEIFFANSRTRTLNYLPILNRMLLMVFERNYSILIIEFPLLVGCFHCSSTITTGSVPLTFILLAHPLKPPPARTTGVEWYVLLCAQNFRARAQNACEECSSVTCLRFPLHFHSILSRWVKSINRLFLLLNASTSVHIDEGTG